MSSISSNERKVFAAVVGSLVVSIVLLFAAMLDLLLVIGLEAPQLATHKAALLVMVGWLIRPRLHARRVIPYCCKLIIVNYFAWHTHTHHPQMMHWSSIGSLLYGTVFVIETRHRKMLIVCVISAG